MNTQYYELMYIIPLKYAGEALQPTVDEVEAKLKELGAEIHVHEQFGKLKFAYKIDHQHQGFYYIAEFTAETDKLQTLHSWLELKKEVLRFITVKKNTELRTSLDVGKEQLAEKAQEAAESNDEVVQEAPAKEEKASEEKKEEVKEEKPKKKAAAKKAEKKEESEEEKVSLEDLDKKLDQILDSEVPTI